MRKQATGAALAALAAMAVVGCGSSGSSGSATGSSGSATGSSGTGSKTSSSAAGGGSTVAATSSAAAGGAAAATAPGTKLQPGQTAMVKYTTTLSSGKSGPSYPLKVTVDSIKKGSLDDFKGIQLDASQKAGTPVYVRVHMTNVGPAPFKTKSNDPAFAIQGVDSTGANQQSVTFLFGTLPACPDVDTPKVLAPGKSFSTCLTFLVPGGIKKAAYTGTQAYFDSPVTWAST